MSTSRAPIIPKRERSPTPPLSTLQPRRSGVKLIAPLPKACRRSSPNYFQARKEWVKEEIKALNALGLTVKNKFLRDDGLSLEWESPVPVWPDSLKPANQAPPSTSSPVNTARDVDVEMQIAPEPVSDPARSISAEREDQERQATELEDLAIEFLKRYVRTFDTERAELEGAYAHNALFSYSVHEYVSVPRNSVAAAFTNPSAGVYRFAPRKGSRNLLLAHHSGSGSISETDSTRSVRNLYSGPSEIVKVLQSLGPHKFCARSPTELHWNVLALELGSQSTSLSTTSKADIRRDPDSAKARPPAEPLVFLSSHGDLTLIEGKGSTGVGREKRLSFDQCFLLQRHHGSKGSKRKMPRKGGRSEDEDEDMGHSGGSGNQNHQVRDNDADAEWPLVAINHQLTVRDLTLRPMSL